MLLCIDTATVYAGIALVNRERSLGYEPLSKGGYSDSILPTIDQVLKKAHALPADLAGVMVIKGPGSFTSLRVGIAVANQFAHQLKIPIIGVRTDEWHAKRTEEKDFIYIQSMNREEIYVKEFGRYSGITPQAIVSIRQDYDPRLKEGHPKYLGELTPDHQKEVPKNFAEIADLRSVEKTWVALANSLDLKPQKTYELIEPYYGKEPTITKSKRRLSVNP